MSSHIPEPVRSTMQALADGLYKILGDRLLGVYLGGSIAMGDFCDASSDLDFLVVTRGALSLEDALAVGLLHKALLRRYPYAARLEGDYAPVDVLIPEGTSEPVPGCERGRFLPKVGEIMVSADNIANMRETGISFFGPEPGELLPPVSPAQVREAVRSMLEQGIEPCETAREAAAEFLGLLRSALALEQGRPVSKTEGAAWGMEHLDSQWHGAIRRAVAVRSGQEQPDDIERLCTALPQLEQWVRTRYVHQIG